MHAYYMVHKQVKLESWWYHYQGSPLADIKAEWVGVFWAGFVTTSIDFLPISKLN